MMRRAMWRIALYCWKISMDDHLDHVVKWLYDMINITLLRVGVPRARSKSKYLPYSIAPLIIMPASYFSTSNSISRRSPGQRSYSFTSILLSVHTAVLCTNLNVNAIGPQLKQPVIVDSIKKIPRLKLCALVYAYPFASSIKRFSIS